MIQAQNKLAVAALAGVALALAAAAVASGGVNAIGAGQDVAAQRIEAAFALVPDHDQVLAFAGAAPTVRKGDRLTPGACSGQTWPESAAGCVVKADGSVVPMVRTVTIGEIAGPATTVLVRIPAPQVALR